MTFTVFSVLAIVPGLHFRHHYFLLLAPAVALLNAAAVTAILRLAGWDRRRWAGLAAAGLVVALVVIVSGLTVSRLRYRSFKEIDLRNRRSYLYVLPLAVILVAILTHPEISLLTFGAVYLLSGPVGYAWSLATRRRQQPGSAEIVDEPSAR